MGEILSQRTGGRIFLDDINQVVIIHGTQVAYDQIIELQRVGLAGAGAGATVRRLLLENTEKRERRIWQA